VLVVVLALLAVFGLCLFLVGDVEPGERGTVLTSAFTVLGTIVGAYTGVKVGSSGRKDAEKARDVESAKVEALAARVRTDDWGEAMDEVPRRLSEWETGGRSSWGSDWPLAALAGARKNPESRARGSVRHAPACKEAGPRRVHPRRASSRGSVPAEVALAVEARISSAQTAPGVQWGSSEQRGSAPSRDWSSGFG
jgi:hypothetical protein